MGNKKRLLEWHLCFYIRVVYCHLPVLLKSHVASQIQNLYMNRILGDYDRPASGVAIRRLSFVSVTGFLLALVDVIKCWNSCQRNYFLSR